MDDIFLVNVYIFCFTDNGKDDVVQKHKKKVKIRLVKSMHYLTDLTSYLSKSSGQILLFIRFYMLAIFCQVPNTKSVPSCLMLNLGSFKNTKTVIIAISGLKTMEMRKD